MNTESFFDGLLAKHYDDLYGSRDVRSEIKLVLERSRTWLSGGRISALDVGCGTGHHLVALKEQRVSCVGMDIAPALVELARERLPDCRIEVADLRTFALGQQFDLILGLFGVFDYLWRIEDVRAALRSIAMHLRRGGIFYFTVSRAATMNPQPQERTVELEDGGKLYRKTTVTDYDPDGITVKLRYEFERRAAAGGITGNHYEIHIMRAWTKTELILFLGEAGLRIENSWPDGATLHVMARRTG